MLRLLIEEMQYSEYIRSLILHYSLNSRALDNKGAGRSKYIKLGIASSVEHELPVLQEEWKKLERQYYLSEGIFGNIKNKIKTFLKSAQQLIKRFYENVIKKVIGNLRVLAEKGIEGFLDALGLEYSAKVSMDTPSW